MSHHSSSPAPAPPPLTTQQIDDLINSGKDPANTPGANWAILEGLTNSEITAEDISSQLQSITGATQSPASVAIEDFGGVTFKAMYDDFHNASGTLDNGNGATWHQIATSIYDASTTFQQALAAQEAQKGWVGKTHAAAKANMFQSLPAVATMAAGANALGLLIDAFANTIFQTRWYMESNGQPYADSLARWPNETDLINQTYNSFAQQVMKTVYAPNIASIASNNPGFPSPLKSTPQPPSNSNVPPPPTFNVPPPPAFNVPPPPGGLNGAPPPGGLNGAAPPPPLGGLAGSPLGGLAGSPSSGTSGLSSALGQGANGLAQPLQQALGAAQQGQGGAPAVGAPAGGAPALAPNGMNALAKPGAGPGGHGGGGGGAGIGSMGRDTLSPLGAPVGAPVGAASKGTELPGSGLSRPGVPAGAGGSSGGAPPPGGGGGQRGSTGKEHKANKALRRTKNGELVIGEVDAVVPVIGDDGPDEAEPAQRAPAPPAPQVPRPPVASSSRRPVAEQQTEVGR